MMTDPLIWSPINLGRWGGTQVRIHFSLIAFVVVYLLGSALGPDHRVGPTACWLLLLLAALAIHEGGHALVAWWLGNEPDDVRLWPLGNMVGPTPSSRSSDHVMVAIAGPTVSAAMVVIAAVVLNALGAQFVWNPFGNPTDPGSPVIVAAARKAALTLTPYSEPWWRASVAAPYSAAWFFGWFGYLNWVILLANLVPALPFDLGRVFRAYLANTSISTTKDGMIPPILARSCAIILFIGGLVRLLIAGRGDGLTLLVLALLIEWMVRTEARMIEDGGFYDDGVFGYDFSEGYTSLEGSPAKVRPYRESALKRWRRRRSELRRQRRQAREAAEERRMDEILEKIHREGRPALTDEENRFLVRVSVKYRNKPRARD
jgi:Zn-dependent protease